MSEFWLVINILFINGFSLADHEDSLLTDLVAAADLLPARGQGELRNNRGENIQENWWVTHEDYTFTYVFAFVCLKLVHKIISA